MIHLDTSALVAALTGPLAESPRLREWVDRGIRLGVSTLVLYEWWRGPRTEEELAYQELLLPRASAVVFGPAEAALAADLYGHLGRARPRSGDIAIAACALTRGAALWTLNPADFRDIRGLELV